MSRGPKVNLQSIRQAFISGIFKLKAGAVPTFEYFNVRGYLCPHPTVKDSAVEMEFSNYANNRGLTEDLSFLSDEFFQRVVFSKAADKN